MLMPHLTTFLHPGLLLLGAGVQAAVDLEAFIAVQRPVSLRGALANIGPNGTEVPGAGAGFVVASPSKTNPNYFYTWSRDAALTLKMIVDEFIFGYTELEPYIEDYIHAQAVLQTVNNPSGAFLPAGLSLGEPKYTVEGKRFNGNWGRPQRDGPALRAIALITYANWLIAEGHKERVREVLWPVIANDLSYVGQYWNATGFDLWEEVLGSSFFTTQNQYRSLVEGATLAKTLGGSISCAACAEAPRILCFLQSYWNGAYNVANTNLRSADPRTGIDANGILGPISVFDSTAACNSPTLQPCHPRSLATFHALVEVFRNPSLYPLNAGIPAGSGVALGRYAEDVYYGGNPWYLITLGAAEFLYDAVAGWEAQKFIDIDADSLAFFRSFYPSAQIGTVHRCRKPESFRLLANATRTYADSFVAVAQKYTPADGALAEQFSRTDGVPLSAVKLTWSFAAFVTMAERRAGQFPPSWTSTVTAPPAQCVASSVKGTYVPATAAGAPGVNTTCFTPVLFAVNASTYYGENIYLTGNTSDLGAWELDNAPGLSANNYTSSRPLWYAVVPMTPGDVVTYAYVRQQNCGQPWVWESGLTRNRTLVVPPCKDGDTEPALAVDDAWSGPGGNPGTC